MDADCVAGGLRHAVGPLDSHNRGRRRQLLQAEVGDVTWPQTIEIDVLDREPTGVRLHERECRTGDLARISVGPRDQPSNKSGLSRTQITKEQND